MSGLGEVIYDKTNNNVKVNGVVCPVNSELEFCYESKIYVVYVTTVNCRKHKDYKVIDEYSNQLACILKDDAEMVTQLFADLFQLVHIGKIGTKTPQQAITDLIHLLMKNSEYKKMNNVNGMDLSKLFAQIFSMMKKFTDDEWKKIFNFRCMNELILHNNNNLSEQLTKMRDYIIRTITFDKKYINYRSLSVLYDMCLALVGFLLTSISNINMSFMTTNQLIMHELGILVESIIYDRCSVDLFISGQNEKASHVYTQLKQQYPILTEIRNESDLAKITVDLQNRLIKENEHYNVSLYPYVLFYNLPDKLRIKHNLRAFHAATKTDTVQFETFYTAIMHGYCSLTTPLKQNNDFRFYTEESILELLNNEHLMHGFLSHTSIDEMDDVAVNEDVDMG